MRLVEVQDFADTIAGTPWFARVGQPLTADDGAWLGAFVSGLGFAPGEVVPLATWGDAARTANDPAWDRAWWDAEASEQKHLQSRAERIHGAEAALAALSQVTDAALIPTRAAAEGAGDEALARVAAGSAALACHQAALALACGAQPHAFLAKHRLFAAGRWPLGRIAGRWYLF
jgi:hypothetical protein